MLGRVLRAIVSLIIGIIPLLYLGGYFAFLGFPSPYTSLGSGMGLSFLGGGTANSLLPFGAFGVTGLIAFSILSRIGSTVASVLAPRPSMPNFNNMQMPFFSAMQQNSMPENLPADITKAQFVVLRQFRMGTSKPKDIAKRLSMEKSEVEREINLLKGNAYLTKNNKLTGKSMELLS